MATNRVLSRLYSGIWKKLIRVTDMDTKYRDEPVWNRIWDGVTGTERLMEESKVLLITGTTFVNGTAFKLLDKATGKPVYFYGTTAAGMVTLMGYERLCFYGKG